MGIYLTWFVSKPGRVERVKLSHALPSLPLPVAFLGYSLPNHPHPNPGR